MYDEGCFASEQPCLSTSTQAQRLGALVAQLQRRYTGNEIKLKQRQDQSIPADDNATKSSHVLR
jgi:hypothetical protein